MPNWISFYNCELVGHTRSPGHRRLTYLLTISCLPKCKFLSVLCPHFLLPLPTMQWATDLERDGHYLEQAYCFSEAQELGRQSSWTLGILIRMQHTSFISVIFVLHHRLLFWDKTSSVYLVSRFRESPAITVTIRDNLMSQSTHSTHHVSVSPAFPVLL